VRCKGHGAFIARGENYKTLVIKRERKTRHGTCRLDRIIMRENVRIRIEFIWLTAGTRCELL
jgi:hypothetical protein